MATNQGSELPRIQSLKGKGRVREERMDVLALTWARDRTGRV